MDGLEALPTGAHQVRTSELGIPNVWFAKAQGWRLKSPSQSCQPVQLRAAPPMRGKRPHW